MFRVKAALASIYNTVLCAITGCFFLRLSPLTGWEWEGQPGHTDWDQEEPGETH